MYVNTAQTCDKADFSRLLWVVILTGLASVLSTYSASSAAHEGWSPLNASNAVRLSGLVSFASLLAVKVRASKLFGKFDVKVRGPVTQQRQKAHELTGCSASRSSSRAIIHFFWMVVVFIVLVILFCRGINFVLFVPQVTPLPDSLSLITPILLSVCLSACL